tara:strand:+ start:3862 stop:4170 length:309 start_codon:yes stop_codon:yes gene_type:complete
MDKEGLDSITKLMEMSLWEIWPQFEFDVKLGMTGANKRVVINVTSQVTLDAYINDYGTPKNSYPCFYIFVHPSKLTKDRIEETYKYIIRNIRKQNIIFEARE